MNRRDRRTARIATLMGFEAGTLVVIASLHLSGILGGGSKPFRPTDAGIAEALIGLVLIYGVIALVRSFAHARNIALAAIIFAIVGFIVGLNFTLRGGDAIDVTYHATMLPLLCITLILLVRSEAGRS